MALLPQQRHQALRLAEGIGADHVCPLREERDGLQELANFAAGVGVAEDRQPEGRLGDEDIARDEFEGRAGRVRGALVVSRHDDPRAAGLDDDLGRAEDMAGRRKAHIDAADAHRLAEPRRFGPLREIGAVSQRHDG